LTGTSPEQPATTAGKWSVENEADVWRAFVGARSNEEFCQAWLALLCRQLSGIKAGVVLFQGSDANTFLPIAVWPNVTRDLSFLGKVAERALTESRGIVHRPENTSDALIHVAYPIEVSKRMLGSVVLEATSRSDAEVHALLRQLHWGIAWLHDLSHRRELQVLQQKTDRIGSVMEVVATTLGQHRLQQTLFELTNHLARQLRCSRVAIGLTQGSSLRVTALSHAAWFEKNANLVKLYGAAMEEAHDQLAVVSYEDDPEHGSDEPNTAHGRLARESGASTVLSAPLQHGAECLGVLTFERNTDERFSADDRAWIETLAGLLPAIIDQKKRAERSYIARLREDTRTLLAKYFGPKHLVLKFASTIALVTLAALMLVQIEYRVSAKTVIEGETQRAIVAPFASFVATSNVRPGDLVHKGQVMCTLDDNDLRLEHHKWKSSLEQNIGKLREAMAKHDLAAFQVLNAQIRENEAQLALAEDRLSRARITAPFDGVVIAGDLTQLIGSPVEQGKKLFEIAPLEAYRVILQVDEREIRHVKADQRGKLVISGIAGDPIAFSISKVTPVATAEDGRNFFRVEARLDAAPAHLRPGMEGIGKIGVGDRRLWWILTHTFTDWLRLTLWTWMP